MKRIVKNEVVSQPGSFLSNTDRASNSDIISQKIKIRQIKQ